ncbi:Ig-like domain-containing protein, partial [Streptococcus parasanguinis]|uniref:Ig-like domain-containing protein n=1 Tax=Streptococcus parasanguinis TaxID=1318 RepID=UPI0021DAD0E1
MKNRNIKIFSFVLCLVAMLFALGLNRTSAETPGVTVSGKLVDTIKNIKVTNNEGGNLDWELQQWATFRINADYDLSGKNVKAGDSTVVTVPDALMITNTSFQILDKNTKEVIANAEVSPDNKSITITYTDYVEKHSDTSGNFFFYARIDFKKHPQKGEIPIEITINKETKIGGKVSFTGIGDGNPYLLTKTSWVNEGDKREVQYTISVNRTKQNIKGVTIEDHLKFTNASYVKDSIKIIKGKFSYDTGEWVFSDRVDVTDQHKITISEDGQSFVIDLGDITDQDQYRINYKVRLNYDPADGEVLKNEATLKGLGIESKNVTNAAAVQIAGGAGVGYVYSINIHKVDDANQPLKGAKFRVVRQANNQVIGEFESDENGNIAVGKLLKDKYILTEIEAPSGHIIKKADTVVNVEDFGADHSVTKTIVNPKDKPKETKATIELDKTLTGRDLTDGEFSFELYEGANKLQTVTNKNGKVT